ncbi:MAG: AMP-binding protein, partial [Acidobacteriaceae bacterium]|nr:AMP-binding protein [Acidobacteriaceae bacterium]
MAETCNMLSYGRGPEIELLNRSTGEQLEATARRWPDGLALVSRHQNRRFTWAELLDTADRLACGLHSLGLESGDRVGVWALNCYEWVLLHLGCARAGIVLVSVNPAYRSHELAFVLRKSGMRAIFLRERDERTRYLEILNQVRAGSDLAGVICFDTADWDRLLTQRSSSGANVSVDDVTNIQYTSGTT